MRSFFLPLVLLLTCLNPLLPLFSPSPSLPSLPAFWQEHELLLCPVQASAALSVFYPGITCKDWAEGVGKAAFSSSFEALEELLCPACASGLRAEGGQRVWRQLSDASGDGFSPV